MVWQRLSGKRNRLRWMLISYPKWSCRTWEGTWNWPFDGCQCRPVRHNVLSTKSRCGSGTLDHDARSSRYITTPMACCRRYLTRARMCLVKTKGKYTGFHLALPARGPHGELVPLQHGGYYVFPSDLQPQEQARIHSAFNSYYSSGSSKRRKRCSRGHRRAVYRHLQEFKEGDCAGVGVYIDPLVGVVNPPLSQLMRVGDRVLVPL